MRGLLHRRCRAATVVFLLLATLFLPATLCLLPAASAAQEDSPANGANKKPNLLDIAEAEARKQHSQVNAKIRSALLQLGIYTDPTLAFVQQKMKEIVSCGTTAVPILLEAIGNPSTERTRINSGRMAAMILARIEDPRVKPETHRLLTEGNLRAKINALHYFGFLGKLTHETEIEALLASKNNDLKAEALICLGLMKSPKTPELAAPFLVEKDAFLKLAGIIALTHWGDPAGEALILPVLDLSKDAGLFMTSVRFLGDHGTIAAFPVLKKKYEKGGLKKKQRWALIKTLTSIGRRTDKKALKPIVDFLKRHLDSPDNRTIKEVAVALNELGDDSGVKVLTQQLDRLIAKHSSANYYFRRGEILLDFGKHKQAQRDFNEGLRKDRRGGMYGASIFISLARCYAAEGRFADAERTLRKAELKDTTRLPFEHAEFQAMSKDGRYAKVFRPGWN